MTASARFLPLYVTMLALALTANAGEATSPLRPDIRAFSSRLLATYVFIGGGSGVVVSADGLVLTNNHVIDGLDDLTVRFANGSAHPSHLLGTDPVGDIALLQIDGAADLPHVALAPVEALRVGSEVIAIGNPWGLGDLDDIPTLTQGVLSASRIVRGDYTDAVQGDAPVNPGNSGGPLFDVQGRLLGINGQIRTVSGFRVNSGIGLAIASTQLAAFLPLLKQAAGGYVHHTAIPKGLELTGGADGVTVGKPGDSLLATGDRLLRIAGRPVASVATATGLFASLPFTTGVVIAVTVVHEGTTVALEVPAARQPIPGRPYHGLGIEETDGRIVIDSVDEDSPAAKSELHLGDTLLSANGRALARKIDWIKAMVKLEIGDWLELEVRSKGGENRHVRLLLRRQ